jgi:hypothetical protein
MKRAATAEQARICKKYGLPASPCDPALKVGIAQNVRDGALPINGLRHPPEGDTTGWYFWGGEDPPGEGEDFFLPLHAEHLPSWCPAIMRYLALPPGTRFLVADDYEDVWTDASLLDV